MKISNIQYATALYESAKGKSQSEINAVVANFVKVLEKNNQLKNINLIISKFSEVWNRNEGILEAEVTASRKLESHQVHKVGSYLKDKYKAEKVEIIEKINKNIKGGIIVKVGDEVMDGSILGKLKNLKKKLVN
jgi:F-type H+-transporting ATPase subunit delta